MLDIRHITSSTYHPQSQGKVERMHSTLGHVVRGLVDGHADDWERMLPFVECILRCSPMQVLGGRCPYEVVTGLKPRMPSAITSEQPRVYMGVEEYSQGLLENLRETHKSVTRLQQEAYEREEGTLRGHLSKELLVGMAVLVRRRPRNKEEGPIRFQEKCFPGVYRIKARVGRHTFYVEDLADASAPCPFTQPINADNLIALDLPELELDPGQNRVLEIESENGAEWIRYQVERFAADGRVYLRILTYEHLASLWMDLSTVRYRWVV